MENISINIRFVDNHENVKLKAQCVAFKGICWYEIEI